MKETKGEKRKGKVKREEQKEGDEYRMKEVVQLSPGVCMISAVQFSLKKITLTIYNVEVRVSQ